MFVLGLNEFATGNDVPPNDRIRGLFLDTSFNRGFGDVTTSQSLGRAVANKKLSDEFFLFVNAVVFPPLHRQKYKQFKELLTFAILILYGAI